MRCPKCKFISSDKRDLCPKCLADLRPEKHRLGLPITRPKLSYEELLQLAKSKKAKSNKAASGASRSKAVAAKSIKATKKPLWEQLLSKFSLIKGEKKVSLKEAAPVIKTKPESQLSEIPQSNLSNTETIAPTATETATGTETETDKNVFESLFIEPPAEPSDEDLSKIGEEMSLKLSQALSSTELLRELPTTNYASQISQATPEVVQFDEDDDALLEEQLDQILGDDVLEISPVKTPKKINPVQPSNSIKVDDLEISFEFEMGSNEEVPESIDTTVNLASEINEAPSFESKSINQLEEALRALDAEFETCREKLSDRLVEQEDNDDTNDESEIDLLESLKNDLLGLEDNDEIEIKEADQFDLSLLKSSIPARLKQSPEKLSNYLLEVLADTVGCKPEDLFYEEDTEIVPESLDLAPVTEPTLWDIAESELANLETEGEELELNQLFSITNREQLVVLFDAALLALEDSKLENVYQTKVKLSEDKQLESEDLEIIFEKYGDSAVVEHNRNFTISKNAPATALVQSLEPSDATPIQVPTLSILTQLWLTLSSAVIGLFLGALHLWMFDLLESGREAILSHQLIWLTLPYVAKNLGGAIVLSSIILIFRCKTSER